MTDRERTAARRALRRVYKLARPITDAELEAETDSLRKRPVTDYDDLHFRAAAALEVAGVDLEEVGS